MPSASPAASNTFFGIQVAVRNFITDPLRPQLHQIIARSASEQSLAEKRSIVQRVGQRWLPMLRNGRISPVLHGSFPLAEAASAHRLMETNATFGKVILEVG